MAMAKGECLALLGQNGAGKTTLVNVVSGLLSPTHGHAFIFGKSVTEDLAALRSIMGRCPQHDLLWLGMQAPFLSLPCPSTLTRAWLVVCVAPRTVRSPAPAHLRASEGSCTPRRGAACD